MNLNLSRRRLLISLFGLALLLLLLPFTLKLAQTVQYYLSEALGKPANIVVDVSVDYGPITPIWQALAQGGEEKSPFDRVIGEVSALRPTHIRIDHIYDFYDVVKRVNGQLVFDWTKLDKVVNQILQTGATPVFSLSYMPPVIAKEGEITNPPVNWDDWSTVVYQTVQHYSGRNDRNLNDVIYEVWNEPDLFGNWKIGGEKDYRLLYKYAVIGANQTQNTNPFKIGGPATTAPYQAWVDGFLDYIKANRLRIDFYSWHRYSLEPEKFWDDVNRIDTWLFKNAGHTLEKYVTEWGSVSENSSYHDTNFDAIHLVAVIRQLIQRVDLAFIFEIKDGPSPKGEKYWGRWGLLTHEVAGPIERKPKYYALQLLNKIRGNLIRLEGEGSWVTGFATKNNDQVFLVLTNLDPHGRHRETVPFTFINLDESKYSYEELSLRGTSKTTIEYPTVGRLEKQIFLPPNSVILIKLTKVP